MEDIKNYIGVIRETSSQDYQKLPGSFWIVTSYYNPLNTKSKEKNYHYFKDKLKEQGANLLTVECAFKGQDFSLNKDDADLLIQVRSNSVLWQKERLLNIGLDNLPSDCDKIAWLDADVVITDDNWVKIVSELLEHYPLVKPFEEAIRLTKKETEKVFIGEELEPSSLYSFHNRQGNNYYGPDTDWKLKIYLAVFGLCARRDVFREAQFYDRMIVCSGDMVIINAFLNTDAKVGDFKERLKLSDPLVADINNWYQKMPKRRLELGICYLKGVSLLHLFHGKPELKNYVGIVNLFTKHNFDPVKDLRISGEGSYEWSSNKPGLHQDLIDYFKDRNEDDNRIRNIKNQFILAFKNLKFGIVTLIKSIPLLADRMLGIIGKRIKKISPNSYQFLKNIISKKNEREVRRK